MATSRWTIFNASAEPRRRRPAAESLEEVLCVGLCKAIVSLLRFCRVKQSYVNSSGLKSPARRAAGVGAPAGLVTRLTVHLRTHHGEHFRQPVPGRDVAEAQRPADCLE